MRSRACLAAVFWLRFGNGSVHAAGSDRAGGGLNLYGYANGDPVNFSDPFGLDAFVNCRSVQGIGTKEGGHCALRIVDKERDIDITVELLADDSERGVRAPLGHKSINWVSGRPSDYDDQWVRLAVPAGRSSHGFDRALLNSALRQQREVEGDTYTPSGTSNSNRFIFDVIRRAGGVGVRSPATRFLFGAPGLCGGNVLMTGDRCSP